VELIGPHHAGDAVTTKCFIPGRQTYKESCDLEEQFRAGAGQELKVRGDLPKLPGFMSNGQSNMALKPGAVRYPAFGSWIE
jgi:hypothetical protein